MALIGYSAQLALVLLAPTSSTQSAMVSHARDNGLSMGFSPARLTQSRAEFVCNALILAPVSALGMLLAPRSSWRDWVAIAFVLAACVELAQGLFLPHRTASSSDVVANTLGGLLGALIAALLRAGARSRPPG